MAFPTIVGVTAASWLADTTPQVTLTTESIPDGSLLLVFACDPRGTEDAFSAGASGTTKQTEGDIGNDTSIAVFYHEDIDSTWEGATLTFSWGNTDGGDDTVLIAIVIADWADWFISSFASSASGSANPPALNPGLGAQDFLWLVIASGEDYNLGNITPPANYTELIEVDGPDSTGPILSARFLNAASEDPGTLGNGSGESWGAFTLAILGADTTATLEQEGYRWREDDGDEDGATWRETQDTETTVATGTTIRLRTLIDADGDPPTGTATLQYKRSDEPDSEWRTI